jgi:hypothetical protein
MFGLLPLYGHTKMTAGQCTHYIQRSLSRVEHPISHRIPSYPRYVSIMFVYPSSYPFGGYAPDAIAFPGALMEYFHTTSLPGHSALVSTLLVFGRHV